MLRGEEGELLRGNVRAHPGVNDDEMMPPSKEGT